MDFSQLDLPTTSATLSRDSSRSRRNSRGSKRHTAMTGEELDQFMRRHGLRDITDEDAAIISPTVNLHRSIASIRVSSELFTYGYICDDHFGDIERLPTKVYGPPLATILITKAVQSGFNRLTPDEQHRISNTSSILHDPSNSPAHTITWLAKSLVEEPIILHGPMVNARRRKIFKDAGLPVLSHCAFCHHHSSIRAQIKSNLLPLPARIPGKRNKNLNPLQCRLVAVDSVLQGHYQQPLAALPHDTNANDSMIYAALHKLMHHTLQFLYDHEVEIPNENNRIFTFYSALTEDIRRYYDEDEDDEEDDADFAPIQTPPPADTHKDANQMPNTNDDQNGVPAIISTKNTAETASTSTASQQVKPTADKATADTANHTDPATSVEE